MRRKRRVDQMLAAVLTLALTASLGGPSLAWGAGDPGKPVGADTGAAGPPGGAQSTTTSGNGYTFDSATGTLAVSSDAGITAWNSDGIGRDSVTTVIVGSGVQNICPLAFQDCTNLTAVDLSGATALQTIGTGAFGFCSELATVDFPQAAALGTIGEAAFYGSGLTALTIPGTVTAIGTAAFAYCSDLATADLSRASALETIGMQAFFGSGITVLTIPGAVTAIGMGAFNFCPDLATADLSNAAALQTIGESAFQDTGITALTIPGAVTTIGRHAFSLCADLAAADLSNATALQTIGERAFDGCIGLAAADLSNATALQTIGENAFRATGITALTIPGAVTTVGRSAFDGCTGLTALDLSDATALASIGAFAFCGTGLATATIPKGVTTIGRCAFYQCADLTTAVFMAKTPPALEPDVFSDTHADLAIRVPIGTAAAYRTTAGFVPYEGIIFEPAVDAADGGLETSPGAKAEGSAVAASLHTAGEGGVAVALVSGYRETLPARRHTAKPAFADNPASAGFAVRASGGTAEEVGNGGAGRGSFAGDTLPAVGDGNVFLPLPLLLSASGGAVAALGVAMRGKSTG